MITDNDFVGNVATLLESLETLVAFRSEVKPSHLKGPWTRNKIKDFNFARRTCSMGISKSHRIVHNLVQYMTWVVRSNR